MIVAGTRTIRDTDAVFDAIDTSGFPVTEIVSGGAVGVDSIGEAYAREHGLRVEVYRADWGWYGRAAGPKRNELMADYADALVAVWDGKSRGTRHMIGAMRRRRKPVHLVRVTA